MKKSKRWISMLIITTLILATASGCGNNTAGENKPGKRVDAERTSVFTDAEDEKLPAFKAQVKPYTVEKNLANVVKTPGFYEVEERHIPFLEKNAFVVDMGDSCGEFFKLYEINRYVTGLGNFVTSDSMVHNYHLYFDYLLSNVEKNSLYGHLSIMTSDMFKESVSQYSELKGTKFEKAALKNIAFFAVAARILGENVEIPKEVKPYVDEEIAKIKAHRGIDESNVLNMNNISDNKIKEDYSQYIPRGHYNKTEKLKKYFGAMMWYGRASFLKKNEEDMKSVMLMTMALNKGKSAELWANIYDVTSFFTGDSDDANMDVSKKLLDKEFGKIPDTSEIKKNDEKVAKVLTAFKNTEGNKINSIPIMETDDAKEATDAFRFMGQRSTLDAEVMQNLIYRKVGENSRGERRMLPKSLDFANVMGSDEAEKILKKQGDYEYRNYPENVEKMKKKIAEASDDSWRRNLYIGWIDFLRPLLKEVGEGYPSFMNNEAWEKKQLNTFLSSWTELKHDTILYSKQIIAEMGGGGGDEYDDSGYVEPVPELYLKLTNLCKRTSKGLEKLNLLNENDKKNLKKLENLSRDLMKISIKELEGKDLDKKEYDLIRSYGGQLEHFWLETLGGKSMEAMDPDAAIIADVATDPNGSVLEEANGRIANIIVIAPIKGKLRVVSGGVFVNYEFKQPISNRLTDEEWQNLIMSVSFGEADPKVLQLVHPHEWTKDYAVWKTIHY